MRVKSVLRKLLGLCASAVVVGGWELVEDADGWDDVSHLELATLGWVHWFNEERLHGYCGHVPPAEYEAAFYADNDLAPSGLGNQ